ncbi:MAG: hypothetical protein HKO66_08840 [Saprospiraceae bacterium]|nr:hypothetical protein [Bacteroidia bacterium]NNE16762.1 hypothetical protein [Saprospiraceae bacterium]NNL92323.1 hypothetical protein [Saprospiraceae bacterium]
MCLSNILFYPSRHYGFVTDFINWLNKYENGNFKDVLTCFEYPGLHQFFHLVNFILYNIIGTNTTAWYIILASLHGLNAYVLFSLAKKIITLKGNTFDQKMLPITISIIFLIYPFNIEAVTWKACLHYLIILQFLLLGLHLLLNYIQHNIKSSLWLLHLTFILSLFTLELSFIFPAIYFVIIIYYAHQSTDFVKNTKRLASSVILPQITFLVLYLILSKYAIGDFIGHYGAEKHVVFDPKLIASNAWKYFFKHLFYVHFWSFKYKQFVYESLIMNNIFLLATTISSVILLLFILSKKENGLKDQVLLLILFVLALAPIITLYFYWQHPYENDRYGYLASPFIIAFVVKLLCLIRNNYLRIVTFLVFAFINVSLFINVISRNNAASKCLHGLLSDFKIPKQSDNVFILGMPDNFQGLYLFRDYKNNAHILKKSLDLMYNKRVTNKITPIAQFNQKNLNDSLKVDFIDSKTIHVGFKQSGNWFWKGGIGLSNYKTDLFNVEKKSGYYKITFSNASRDDLFLISVGTEWQSFRWPEYQH